MSILSVKHVTVTLPPVVAIEDVSFEIERGEYVCLVGANGSGKSSLLRAIMGLLPLKGGQVEMAVPLSRAAYLAQVDGVPRDFPATAWEVVLCGTQKAGQSLFYTAEDRRYAADAMRRLGISGLGPRPVGQLSGGQRQRVFLARALCRNPSLLLLDEPCAGLDAATTRELYDLLSDLHAEGATILMATHDLHDLEGFPARVIALENRLLFDGPLEKWRRGH